MAMVDVQLLHKLSPADHLSCRRPKTANHISIYHSDPCVDLPHSKLNLAPPEAQCPALFPQVSPPRLGTTATAWFDRVDAVNVNLSPRDGKRGTHQLNQNASNV
jgi:hypothetical protein